MKPETIETLRAERDLAHKAVVHVLRRIRGSADVRYHMGYGTQSLDLLTEAHATISGCDQQALENWVLCGTATPPVYPSDTELAVAIPAGRHDVGYPHDAKGGA